MDPSNRSPAIVIGLNANGLAVARCLGQMGVRVIAFESETDRPEVSSRFVHELVSEKTESDEELIRHLISKANELEERAVLFPVSDVAVSALARHLSELGKRFHVAMPDPELIGRLLDKRTFHAMALEGSYPVPRSWTIQSEEELPPLSTEIRFPCIVKPVARAREDRGRSGPKAVLCQGSGDLTQAYLRRFGGDGQAIIQEYIPGGDDAVYFCLQAYGRSGELLASFPGRKIRQWRPLVGGTALCRPVESPTLERTTEKFFSGLGMVGLCSMEYKRDSRDGTFYMVEPTVGRTDWQSAIANFNRVPLPYLVYRDQVDLPQPAVTSARGRCAWIHLGSDRCAAEELRKSGKLSLWQWLWSLRPPIRGAFFDWGDPKPFLVLVQHRMQKKVLRLFRRNRKNPSRRT